MYNVSHKLHCTLILFELNVPTWSPFGYNNCNKHNKSFFSNTYILLDGLVCSIVGYFYELRRILASP